MDKYIYDDKNGLWYELQGDYYIPCLILPAEKEQPIGLWGQRHLRYLKEYHRNTYTTLLTSGRLNTYLADIDKQAQERMERLTEQMKHCLLYTSDAADELLCVDLGGRRIIKKKKNDKYINTKTIRQDSK